MAGARGERNEQRSHREDRGEAWHRSGYRETANERATSIHLAIPSSNWSPEIRSIERYPRGSEKVNRLGHEAVFGQSKVPNSIPACSGLATRGYDYTTGIGVLDAAKLERLL